MSAGSRARPARLDAWPIVAPKGYDERKQICRACVAQSPATNSVRTKIGRPEKGSGILGRRSRPCVPYSNSHSIPFAPSREPHIAYPPVNVWPFPDVIVSPDGVEALGIHVQTPHKAMEGGRQESSLGSTALPGSLAI